MSTRRLILTALVCGLAILVAGGIWLFLLARNEGSTPATVVDQLGTRAAVGPLSVTVLSADVSPSGDVALSVEMEAVSEPVTDPATGWAVFSNRNLALLDRVDPPPTVPDACANGVLAQGDTVRCRVFFHGDAAQVQAGLQAVYGHGSSRALWSLPA